MLILQAPTQRLSIILSLLLLLFNIIIIILLYYNYHDPIQSNFICDTTQVKTGT